MTVVQHRFVGNTFEHSVGNGRPSARPNAGAQHQKLVATKSSKQVIGAQGLTNTLNDDFEHFIARQMTLISVDITEVVNVEHHQRHRVRHTARSTPSGCFKGGSVEHASQRITRHLPRNALRLCLRLDQAQRQLIDCGRFAAPPRLGALDVFDKLGRDALTLEIDFLAVSTCQQIVIQRPECPRWLLARALQLDARER